MEDAIAADTPTLHELKRDLDDLNSDFRTFEDELDEKIDERIAYNAESGGSRVGSTLIALAFMGVLGLRKPLRLDEVPLMAPTEEVRARPGRP